MNIFGKIFKRDGRDGVTWASLSPAQQRAVARKLAGGVMGLVKLGRGYEAVSQPFSSQRRAATVETSGEDKQLTPVQRNQLVNLGRDMMRNAPERVMQDQQLRVNTVGCEGGKLYASFPKEYRDAAEEVMHYFNKVWSLKAEFTFRKNFNWILKTALTAQDVGGNAMLVFDDGILTGGNGTGRVRGFEADEIAEIPQSEFEKRFPKGWTQSRGFIYNQCGMFCGLFASTSQRGKAVFDPSAGFVTLRLDPFDDEATPNFILLGDMRRFNQGRAVSPLVSALTALVDLHETVASEAQAAKLNAQMVGQILESETAEAEDEEPGFSDREVEDATQALPDTVKFTTKELKAIGAHFDKLPPGLKIELLDTKRPNLNIIAYVEHVTGVIGATRGLARVYATLKAQTSYTAFRGEQAISEQSFRESRKDMERNVCDPIARLVIARAVRLGIIKASLPEHWGEMLAWNWPKMIEVNEKDAQSALKLKLENGVTSLTRELGPGEMERILDERKREKELFDEAGLIYPGTVTASGQIVGEEDDGGEDDGESPDEPLEPAEQHPQGGEDAE
ncbi:MAG: phage portal protein [Kiritimatiellae bacterium]|nr:phage portal protein [Kiritimatiellia bacterium]